MLVRLVVRDILDVRELMLLGASERHVIFS